MTPLVVLTLAAESGDSLARRLSAAGLEVEHWPLVRLVPAALETIRPVLQRLAAFDWIFLPSPSAVRLVAQLMKEAGVAWPEGVRAGLVGPASVEAFRDCFGDAHPVDTPIEAPHDALHLVSMLDSSSTGTIKPALRALVLNRPDGRLHWLDALRERSQSVEVVPVYAAEPVADEPPPGLIERLRRRQQDGRPVHWVAGSSSQVDTLLRALPSGMRDWAQRQLLLAPHPAVTGHARAQGFEKAATYDDRRDLVERLQYAGNRAGRAPVEPADSVADNEEVSVLTLDQQKDPALADARSAGEPTTQVGGVGESMDAAAARKVDATRAVNATRTPEEAEGPDNGSRSSSAVLASAPIAATPPTAIPATATSPIATPATATPAAATPPTATSATATPAAATPTTATPAAASPASATSTRPGSGSTTRIPEPPAPPPPLPPSPPPTQAARRGGGIWPLLLLLLVGLLAAGGWWYMQQRFLAAERQSAQRVQEAEARSSKLDEQIRALRDAQSQLVSRSSALEAKIAQSATQQEQLAGLYEEIAKARGEGALAEVEQSVMMANQHLELTGNVQAALLALQNAERRLGESEQAQATAARRSVAQDIERLKALPAVDLTRSAARLDEVINGVDRLPLLADADDAGGAPTAGKPAAPGEPPTPAQPAEATAASSSAGAAPASPATDEQPWWRRAYSTLVDAGARGLDVVKEEFQSLVTIRRIDKPDSLLLSPEQKQTARDNLKLLLLNARLNLLNRHEELFRQDLTRAIEGMQRLFDVEQPEVKSAIAALQGLQSQPLALNMPSLTESLGAVRAARAAAEKRS